MEGEDKEAGETSATSEQLQVMAFSTRGELGQYASKLQLTRTPLAELKPVTSLSDNYAGGKVLSIFSGELTQGSVVLLLQDSPRSDKYVQCVLNGDITRLLPASALLGTSEVYVHRARVQQTVAESSQEMEVEIRVEGEHEKIWIVNREAGGGGFLPSRQPSEFQGRGGNARKARRQKHMQAGLERERKANNKMPLGPEPPPTSGGGSTSVNATTAPSTTSSDNRTQPGQSDYDTATHYATGPEPPPSDARNPDISEVPGSHHGARRNSQDDDGSCDNRDGEDVEEEEEAEREGGREGSNHEEEEEEEEEGEREGGREGSNHEEEEEEGEREGGREGSNHSETSSSESDEEQHDMGRGNRQDSSLFPYQRTLKEQQGYTYRKLTELEAGLEKVYVFGVVTDFQPPFQTKGRDFCSIVNIVDESVTDPFKCTFFHSNQDKLPKVSKVGEIVSFHRINIKLFPSGIQGIGLSFSSSLSFAGRLGSKVKPRTGSMSYTFTAQDRSRVRELRLWNARNSCPSNPFLRGLREITVGTATSADLVCQVLSVSLGEPATECHTAVLCVWDGTQTRHRSLQLDLSSFNTTSVDSELLQVARSCCEYVVVYGRELVREVVTLVPGQFVCLQNLQVKEHTAQYNVFKDVFSAMELRLDPAQSDCGRKPAVKVLSVSDINAFELRKVLKSHRKRQTLLFRSLPPDIVPSTITDTPHCQQRPISLSDLTSRTASPAKFLCVVKVLGIEPWSVEELVQLCCPVCKHKVPVTRASNSTTFCSVCPQHQRKKKKVQQALQPMYLFKLLVADETGHITVYMSGHQAAKFLVGFPPAVFQQPRQRMALLERLYRLTGGNDPFDANSVTCVRPWVAVCLVSMTSSSVLDSTAGIVTYHLFDTVLNTEQ